MKNSDVIIRGGLGNQIFGLLQAYRILLSDNNRVSLNLTDFSFLKRVDRQFLLDKLYPNLKNEFKSNNKIFSFILYFYARFLEKFFLSTPKDRIPGDKAFKANFLNFYKISCGYFQKIDNSKLDNKALNLLIARLQPYLKKDVINYLAIHLRRGDYISFMHNSHGVIAEKYLFQEAKKLMKICNFDGITIFSDSPELIDIDMFKSLKTKIIIDRGGDTLEVFRRMINHRGLIASNSTFSLWAGIIGEVEFFSLPEYWMKDIKSRKIGLSKIKRYKCKI